MTPEGKIKAKVNKALKALGADCWRFMPVQTGYGSPALDYLLCYKGRFIAIETKRPGGKLTPLQQSTKAAMEAAGALVLIVDNDDSLAAALKIIFWERFGNGHTITADGRNRTIEAAHSTQEKGGGEQYLRQFLKDQAPDKAACRGHGTPRTASRGRA